MGFDRIRCARAARDPAGNLHELAAVTLRPLIVMIAACGGKQSPRMAGIVRQAIQLEWKVVQGEGDDVLVSLIVAGKREELGPIPAATETEAGTPRTCALRSAHPLRTELT